MAAPNAGIYASSRGQRCRAAPSSLNRFEAPVAAFSLLELLFFFFFFFFFAEHFDARCLSLLHFRPVDRPSGLQTEGMMTTRPWNPLHSATLALPTVRRNVHRARRPPRIPVAHQTFTAPLTMCGRRAMNRAAIPCSGHLQSRIHARHCNGIGSLLCTMAISATQSEFRPRVYRMPLRGAAARCMLAVWPSYRKHPCRPGRLPVPRARRWCIYSPPSSICAYYACAIARSSQRLHRYLIEYARRA